MEGLLRDIRYAVRSLRRTERGSNFLRLVARLKPGVTPAQAEADLGAISNRLRDRYPDDNENITSPRVLKLQDEVVGGYREGLWLIIAAVVVVLLIACANLASFQLARAALRHKEMAIRSALGAKRKILMRQVLTESMLLAILGGGLGLLLSFWAKDLLLAMSPADFPRASAVSIDGRVLLFSLLVTLFAGLALGVIAYVVSQRTREIGIRLALGATPRHILRLMIGQGMKLTLIGVTIGFAGAIVVTRLMRSLLFAVAPTDLMTFGISSVVLIAVALLACFIPARRATKVDPLVALRYE